MNDSKKLYSQIKLNNLSTKFDRDNSYPFTKMLKNNIIKNSWAINWYASNFLLSKFTAYPKKSMALHIVQI